MFKVAIIVGSLSKNSINRKLANAIAKLGADRFAFSFVEIGDLPLYNYDLDPNPPEAALRLKREIQAADALLFVTPEYLRSIPAVLKNALEWGSRPYGQNSFAGKPAATAGLSGGPIGTAAAQQHLRNILVHDDLAVMGQPELFMTNREDFFTADGSFADASTVTFVTGFLDRFEAWIGRFAAA